MSLKYLVVVAIGVGAVAPAVSAEEVDYFSLSLEELVEIEVTSVSKREEKASEVAAAIHIITGEDIKRSGATSIPEALRLAPGVNVARAQTGQWAISIRGFNAQFANKILVLIDGRAVYTPLFSGVFWDIQDTLLEDVERIEVIRGPGGTIWGANAVNGVINIITKKASATQGSYAEYQKGFQEQQAAFRHGGMISDGIAYRAYGKQRKMDESKLASGAGSNDELDQGRAGFRVDFDEVKSGKLSLQSEAYVSSEGQDLLLPDVRAPFRQFVGDEWDAQGGHLLANWNQQNDASQYSVTGYYDYAERKTFMFENLTQTIDIDFNHSFSATPRHHMMWGLGYRLIDTNIEGTDIISYQPAERSDNLFSAFLQDKVDLFRNELFLTLGSKFEHNDYTGFEWQPSAKLSWLADDRQTLWASVSRAVRTPTRAAHDLSIAVAAVPNGASPTGSLLIRQIADESVDSETLYAYEAGYRFQPTEKIAADLAVFYNEYPNLVSDSQGSPYPDTNAFYGSHFVLPYNVNNNSSGKTFGAELSVDWEIDPALRVSSSYSMLEMDIEGSSLFVSGEGRSPHHQVNLEAHYTPDRHWQVDSLLYYVDELNPSSNMTIPAYWRLDLRAAYKFDNGMQLSLVGQNLLDDQKSEFSSFVYNQQVEIPRTLYGKISWNF